MNKVCKNQFLKMSTTCHLEEEYSTKSGAEYFIDGCAATAAVIIHVNYIGRGWSGFFNRPRPRARTPSSTKPPRAVETSTNPTVLRQSRTRPPFGANGNPCGPRATASGRDLRRSQRSRRSRERPTPPETPTVSRPQRRVGATGKPNGCETAATPRRPRKPRRSAGGNDHLRCGGIPTAPTHPRANAASMTIR